MAAPPEFSVAAAVASVITEPESILFSPLASVTVCLTPPLVDLKLKSDRQ